MGQIGQPLQQRSETGALGGGGEIGPGPGTGVDEGKERVVIRPPAGRTTDAGRCRRLRDRPLPTTIDAEAVRRRVMQPDHEILTKTGRVESVAAVGQTARHGGLDRRRRRQRQRPVAPGKQQRLDGSRQDDTAWAR